ncbi:hypothetical protein [Arenibaculum pallidiluteum]|uniref:hypothetical protein n=1 Tax=Arenibaculum pallidiluteum TaxID=2812559 RepID=UPI001A966D4F|nr:hypothetical protein [Arenibaculum pallidiluteum]
MRFFVPHTNDVQAQAELYRLVRGNVESQLGKLDPRRIWRIAFIQGGTTRIAEVGRPDPYHDDDVFAIFLDARQSRYFVCTPVHGMFNDKPIIIPVAEAHEAEDFDMN